MIDLISISFVKSLGLSPCNKEKHQHKELAVEGIGRMEAKTHGFYHLKLYMTDRWNRSIQFIRPFLAVDRSPRDSQILLGRPTLKEFRISINNLTDSWEIENLPRVTKVSSSRFDREILDGAQVFEVQVVYKPVSKNPDEELKGKEGKDLPVTAERHPKL